MSNTPCLKKYKLAISALLLLIVMQFAAIAHANQHDFKSTDLRCITHLEAEQFSNLLHSTQPETAIQKRAIKPTLIKLERSFSQSLASYSSRAPPSLTH